MQSLAQRSLWQSERNGNDKPRISNNDVRVSHRFRLDSPVRSTFPDTLSAGPRLGKGSTYLMTPYIPLRDSAPDISSVTPPRRRASSASIYDVVSLWIQCLVTLSTHRLSDELAHRKARRSDILCSLPLVVHEYIDGPAPISLPRSNTHRRSSSRLEAHHRLTILPFLLPERQTKRDHQLD